MIDIVIKLFKYEKYNLYKITPILINKIFKIN